MLSESQAVLAISSKAQCSVGLSPFEPFVTADPRECAGELGPTSEVGVGVWLQQVGADDLRRLLRAGSWILAAEGLVMAKKVVVSHRSADTGRKVTKEYADAHPKETIRETRPAPKPKGKGN